MRKLFAATVAALLLGGSLCQAADAAKTGEPLTTDQQKAGYTIGVNIAMRLQPQLGPALKHVDLKALLAGIDDGLNSREPRLPMADMQKALENLQTAVNAEQAVAGKANEEKAKKFLADNKAKADVKTTASGLQYKVIKEGTGKTPAASDMVEVHYRGTLADGTEFDSSYKRGESATFPVEGLIAGWKEALQLMKEGAKWQLVIPAELAYGSAGSPPAIGPNEVLVFEMELIKVKDKPAAGSAMPEIKLEK